MYFVIFLTNLDDDTESNDTKEQLEAEERDEIAKNLAISTDSANQERLKSEITPTDQSVSIVSNEGAKVGDMGEERIKSPDECSDQVSSGNSGNTETGQPFIPQVQIFHLYNKMFVYISIFVWILIAISIFQLKLLKISMFLWGNFGLKLYYAVTKGKWVRKEERKEVCL